MAVAAQAAVYDFIPPITMPQWIVTCSLILGVYDSASKAGDSELQKRAITDLLLLPQQVLTKHGRGGASMRRRLGPSVTARCRGVCDKLRRQYGIVGPATHDGDALALTTSEPCMAAPSTLNLTTPATSAPSRKQWDRAVKRSRFTATVADLTDPIVQNAALRELLPLSVPSTTLPALPIDTPRVTLEDGEETTQLLVSLAFSDSSAGPSGWSNGILLGLLKHAACRTGIITLLRDMLNGHVPHESRSSLLACQLLALKQSSGALRIVCIPELFYRMAAKIAVKKVRATAASLLQPHQYSLGVPGGREQLLRSIQHALTNPDPDSHLALLKVVISKAYNNCDRAAMLGKLYGTPELGQLFRMAEFAYSAPATLLLHKSPDQWIDSCNGLRNGDPLSSLLLSLHLQHIYTSLARVTNTTLYVFTEMVHILGPPRDVMTALGELHKLLARSSQEYDPTQSQFVYFHQDSAPLDKTVTDMLAQHGIPLSQDSVQVMGAIIACDEQVLYEGDALAHSVALEVLNNLEY